MTGNRSDSDALVVPTDEAVSDAPRWRPWLHWMLVVVTAAVAAVFALSIVTVEGDVGPGRVSLRGGWGASATTIVVPPLGDVVFDTHRAPLGLHARIETIDPVQAERLASDEQSVENFDRTATGELRSLLWRWALRALLVAVVAGALAGALVWPRRVLTPVVGATTGVVVVAALLGASWFTYSREGLRDPEYHGTLERAPEILAAIDRTWGGLDQVAGRLRILAANINELSTTVAEAGSKGAGPPSDEIRVLHVSDVHSNPVGLELARGLATGFAVDAIVDTGDLTSFGLPVESRIGALISGMPAPYYLVPGNHDSRANRAALDAYPNVTVVDGTTITIGDLRVLGVADPAITANGEDSDQEANAKRDAQADDVATLVTRQRPDVLAVSSARQAGESFGHVPLVVTGNTHRRSDTTQRGTRILTVGSTGATGLGSFTVKEVLPYEAEVLHFRERRLVAIDYVKFEGADGDYTVSRTIVRADPTSSRSRNPATTAPTVR